MASAFDVSPAVRSFLEEDEKDARQRSLFARVATLVVVVTKGWENDRGSCNGGCGVPSCGDRTARGSAWAVNHRYHCPCAVCALLRGASVPATLFMDGRQFSRHSTNVVPRSIDGKPSLSDLEIVIHRAYQMSWSRSCTLENRVVSPGCPNTRSRPEDAASGCSVKQRGCSCRTNLWMGLTESHRLASWRSRKPIHRVSG